MPGVEAASGGYALTESGGVAPGEAQHAYQRVAHTGPVREGPAQGSGGDFTESGGI
jgi:hypothetical protein